MSLVGEIVGGGPMEMTSYDGAEITLVATVALAPGKPVRLRVTVGETALELEAKSHGSKRREDGRFEVRLRPVSWRREQAEAVREALSG